MLWLLMILATLDCGRAECNMADKECYFHLDIDQKLTMMLGADLVFPENGKLYKYDVKNTSTAEPIINENIVTADGWETPRLVTVANGQMPGPDIIVYEGQIVVVHVKNSLRSESVTLHWHGLHQKGTPWMDGVPWVTQCPIQAGQSFTYHFKAEPQGTFWWHSHMGSQRSKGVFGAFIVKPNVETVAEDRIIQIQDWNHDHDSDHDHQQELYGVYRGREIWRGSLSLDNSFFGLFDIQSGLINGRGRVYNHVTGTSNMAPLTIYPVASGMTYRFRVIGVGHMYPFRVSVDNHNLKIISSDGYDLQPVVVESVVVHPGERFDFELIADQPVGNYWIRGITLQKSRSYQADAILRYDGAPEVEPSSSRRNCAEDNKCLVLNCPFLIYPEPFTECVTFDKMRSLAINDPAPKFIFGQSQEHFLNFALPGVITNPGSVNGHVFNTPDVSLITQPHEWHSPCESPACGKENFCKCTYALQIDSGNTIQIVLTNMGRGKGLSHPIHMHGHSFYVLKMGFGKYNLTNGKIIGDNADIDCQGKNLSQKKTFCNNATWTNQSWINGNVPGLELLQPPRKDTIILPTGSYVVLRIRADNPGIWNMHCHVELHNLYGMQMLLNESYSEIPAAPQGFPECHSYPPSIYRLEKMKNYMEKRGRINDDISTGMLIAVIVLQGLLLFIGGYAVFKNRNQSKSGNSLVKGQVNPGFKYT